MTIKFNTGIQNFLANTLAGDLAAATLSIYTGAQPANANTAASGTKLVDITINAFLPASSGSAALDTTTPNTGTAIATGTAGWGRITSASGVIDGTVGTSGTDFTINSTSITSGAVVTLTAMTIVQPAS